MTQNKQKSEGLSRNRETAIRVANDPKIEKVEPKAAQRPASKGKSPTRYGDWEKDGRCIDF
jgi:hypothetical protein